MVLVCIYYKRNEFRVLQFIDLYKNSHSDHVPCLQFLQSVFFLTNEEESTIVAVGLKQWAVGIDHVYRAFTLCV
jgi:hypothetical protein